MTEQTAPLHRKPRQNRLLPILNWLSTYQRAWLRADVLAGLTVLTQPIPEGIAYAQIAGMPPEMALYVARRGTWSLGN